jgi:hypothetical protein
VIAPSVDRLGPRLHDLVGFLSELRALKIDPFLGQQGTRHPEAVGKAVFQIIDVCRIRVPVRRAIEMTRGN